MEEKRTCCTSSKQPHKSFPLSPARAKELRFPSGTLCMRCSSLSWGNGLGFYHHPSLASRGWTWIAAPTKPAGFLGLPLKGSDTGAALIGAQPIFCLVWGFSNIPFKTRNVLWKIWDFRKSLWPCHRLISLYTTSMTCSWLKVIQHINGNRAHKPLLPKTKHWSKKLSRYLLLQMIHFKLSKTLKFLGCFLASHCHYLVEVFQVHVAHTQVVADFLHEKKPNEHKVWNKIWQHWPRGRELVTAHALLAF